MLLVHTENALSISCVRSRSSCIQLKTCADGEVFRTTNATVARVSCTGHRRTSQGREPFGSLRESRNSENVWFMSACRILSEATAIFPRMAFLLYSRQKNSTRGGLISEGGRSVFNTLNGIWVLLVSVTIVVVGVLTSHFARFYF